MERDAPPALGQLWDDEDISRTVAELMRGEPVKDKDYEAIRGIRDLSTQILINLRRQQLAAAGWPPDEEWEKDLLRLARGIEVAALVARDGRQ